LHAFGCITYTFLHIADAVLGFFGPILDSFLGIFIAALQVATELFAGFGASTRAARAPAPIPISKKVTAVPKLVLSEDS